MTLNYKSTNENPCNMCMPMGGILPYKGIEGAMVMLHGSQGCSTYMRRHMAEHYNEPIDVGSSSLNEKGTVYGGEKNLKQGLINIIMVYEPKIVGVLTTCLAETIGEDVERIVADFLKENPDVSSTIIPGSTPGYGGSHFEGYFTTLRQILKTITKATQPHEKLNIIIPNISPADIRELKRLLDTMDIKYTIFPDFSETLDRPYEKTYKKVPEGGTTIKEIEQMAGAKATIQFATTVEDALSPGKYLYDTYGVPLYNLPIPLGIENTDLLFETIQQITNLTMPDSIKKERGRLIDAMIDSHKYNAQGRAVVYGEPEQAFSVATLCLENGITPNVIATGSKTTKLSKLLQPGLKRKLVNQDAVNIIQETDFSVIRAAAVEAKANIAIGHSDGRYLTEKEGIPLVRHGFPIHDRVGGQRLLSIGYLGTTVFLDRITNTLLENKYLHYRTNMYQEYYKKAKTI
ncbi:nitrogenase component 1 [Desulfuribacillus alkaliarsenatis]|uniref:Nitrogenase n=1 Tax=Desulfuribacillus alkaliarsenatis TaxID=766136 RepID=A0A1E5G0A7_9FIRM|nr:nitrogenase component 1 [Desulfuribacillus alkaliarsenatis]OEF96267.1 nitrogenase [Desulfuribacillus alkaliarsenatis]